MFRLPRALGLRGWYTSRAFASTGSAPPELAPFIPFSSTLSSFRFTSPTGPTLEGQEEAGGPSRCAASRSIFAASQRKAGIVIEIWQWLQPAVTWLPCRCINSMRDLQTGQAIG